MKTFTRRRYSFGLNFLNGLLSGKFESPYLLNLISFRVPQRTSYSSIPFYIPPLSANYLENGPIRRIMSLTNVDGIVTVVFVLFF